MTKLNEQIKPYLEGEVFSNGLEINISKKEEKIIRRIEFIENLCRNKNVVHLGCCDHIALIEAKIKNGTWLHERIFNVAEKCIGIDINKEGIDYLKNIYNYKDVYHADITKDPILTETNIKWDYLILGEILEHINNPIEFLTSIRLKNAEKLSKIVITVPNAFCYMNFKQVKKHSEVINTDHRFWFTPYTLAKILTIAGYKIDDFYFAQDISNKIGIRAKLKVFPFIKRLILYNMLKKHPGLQDSIIMVASF